ncbi:hypothetical protein AKJ09_04903 [Labilithrix luteola]|uniref:OmpR/PhoB-type domain-containing protein n=1 Tax=Labilithrix luteola TaxID=1391654 RepID=A0A0K1PYN0_9BACT|nr:helix-turn-helix domain-containing protein [Labilithrix luteola]AKU98239.1 hypothetical protein AKJ09_04903 [Labilithrix luteola]
MDNDALAERFEDLRRGPLDRHATAHATALLECLAERPSFEPRDALLLTDNAELWAALGLDGRALEIARAWISKGLKEPALARMAARCALVAAPPSVELRLRAVGTSIDADAFRTLAAFMRGDLARAVAIAKRRDFFLEGDDVPAVYGCAYGAWALGLLGRVDEGNAVLASWHARNRGSHPRAQQFILRARAWLASIIGDHANERALVEQAMAICEEESLLVERSFVEVELAFAALRAGDDMLAETFVTTFTPEPVVGRERAPGLIEAYRDLARAELDLQRGETKSARDAATRAHLYFEASGNIILASDALRSACLADLGGRGAREALEKYRRAVYRSRMAHCMRHLRVLEAIVRRPASSRSLELRARDEVLAVPAIRLFSPALETRSADVYVDTVQREVSIRGRGPFKLGEHPVVERVLEVLACSHGSATTIEALFERVWGGSYHPLRHENKLHVTLHRLRQWLDERSPEAGALVVLKGGVVTIDEAADVRVLSFQTDKCLTPLHRAQPREDVLEARVLETLPADGELSTSNVGVLVGASRTAVRAQLSALAQRGLVARRGRGRATRWSQGGGA